MFWFTDNAEGNHEEALDLLCNQKYLSDMGLLDNDNTNIIKQAYEKIKKAIKTGNKLTPKPNKNVQDAIEEAFRIMNDPNVKSFSTTKELFEDLNSRICNDPKEKSFEDLNSDDIDDD